VKGGCPRVFWLLTSLFAYTSHGVVFRRVGGFSTLFAIPLCCWRALGELFLGMWLCPLFRGVVLLAFVYPGVELFLREYYRGVALAVLSVPLCRFFDGPVGAVSRGLGMFAGSQAPQGWGQYAVLHYAAPIKVPFPRVARGCVRSEKGASGRRYSGVRATVAALLRVLGHNSVFPTGGKKGLRIRCPAFRLLQGEAPSAQVLFPCSQRPGLNPPKGVGVLGLFLGTLPTPCSSLWFPLRIPRGDFPKKGGWGLIPCAPGLSGC